MRVRLSAAAALLILVSGTGLAQNPAPADPQCLSAPAGTEDACQQAIDLFRYMVPQLGVAITGGNATLGQGGTLGGLPHFTLGLRGNLVMGHLPELQAPTFSGISQRPDYPVTAQILGLPVADVAIGIFKGLPLALSNVGGVDLLINASYIPNYEGDEITVEPDNPLNFGFGVRVGILQESLLVPGIAASYIKRDLPKTTVTGTLSGANSMTVTVRDLDVKTTAWRLTASKSLVLFTLAAGVGQDTYDASTTVSATTSFGNMPPTSVKQKMTRTNYFGDFSMNLLVMKLIGEIGVVSGGDVPTHNTFETKADASRMYGSVGIRFGF